MLSNPNSNLHQRQRQHIRQNSTPTAFDAPKVPLLHQFQRPSSHRRGMSLDQRPQQRRQISPQETVSNTNPGFQQIQQQHILRETQQQRLARPGQQSPYHSDFGEDDNYLISPLGTPGRSSFDAGYSNCGDPSLLPASYDLYTGPINQIIKVNPNNSLPLAGNHDLTYNDNSTLSPSAYLQNFTFDDASSQQSPYGYRTPHRRRISGGIANRVSKFENMTGDGLSRPVTPPNQFASGYFPPSPAETPYHPRFKTESTPQSTPQQFLETFDTSMDETLKPIKRRSALSTVDIFQEMRREAQEVNGMPSPPNTAPLPTSRMFDAAPMPTSNYMNMANKNVDHLKSDPGYESSNYSPTSASFSPSHMSQQSSPQFPQASLFNDPFENKPTFDIGNSNPYLQRENQGLGLGQTISPTHGASMLRSDSISSITLDESITETGITIDDIATFIEGPGADNKWKCLYPDCNKRFGRKENIKSHVQTHLGDRQYQCPNCQKCFVRQHDLKRHAKIHTGAKPYLCLCGNSFARHDALTRHRQRGMCIGAFEGVVKKVVKRGRPRKPRPDVDERQEKSSRTRSKNKNMSSASSTSGYSESNSGHSPPATFESFDGASFGESSNQMENVRQSHATVDCVSPQAIQPARPVSALSTHSYHSNHRNSTVSLSDNLPSHHASRANTPPSLSQSSSSPTPGNYFDIEGASGELEHGDKPAARFSDLSEEDDIFLRDYNGNMNQLEQDPDLIMMSKYVDAFGANANTNEMFGAMETDDVFFGTS